MKFSETKKYVLELKIIKNQLYIKNIETKEIEKAKIDYHKYAIIYNPNQITKLTVINSKYNEIFVHKNIKNIKIINSKIDNIVVDSHIKELNEIYFINNTFKNIKYDSNLLKINKLITNIDKNMIEKNFNKKIKINYFKFVEIENKNKYMKKLFSGMF